MPNRVGIVTVADSRKGLWRDMEVLSWALSMPSPRAEGEKAQGLSVFCAKMSDRAALSVMNSAPEGGSAGAPLFQGTFEGFVETCDVVVFFETLYINLVRHIVSKGKRVVYVPNLDWATCSDGGTLAWKRYMKELQGETDRFQVWARQPSIHRALLEHEIRSENVPWSIPDEIERAPSVRGDDEPLKFFVNAGFGGYEGRRAVDLVLKAFAKARKRASVHLMIKSIKPLFEYVGDDALNCIDDNVGIIEGFSPRTQVDQLMKDSDVVVSVSRWEGFGYSVIEALHAGKPVITHGGWPVGDLVSHKHNGLLVTPCSSPGKFNLATRWEADIGGIADAMVEIAADRRLLKRLTAPCPGELQARQYAFMLRARALLFEEPEPRVVIFGSQQHHVQPSERYWQMALEAHGYRVDYELANGADYAVSLGERADFILVGKASFDTLKEIRDRNVHEAPVLVWHHDHDTVVKRLQEDFLKFGDIVFAPYEQDGVTYLPPGPRSGGDRGRGLRRSYEPRPEPVHDVSFIGGDCFERKSILKQLQEKVDVSTFGPGMKGNPIYDDCADDVYRKSKIALSLSRFNGTPGYTSNRLFHAAALGTLVFSHTFPGDRKLFHERLRGIYFVKGGDLSSSIQIALEGWEQLKEEADELENYCWRHHSWHDRVYKLAWDLNKLMTTGGRKLRRNSRKKAVNKTLQPIPKGKPMTPPKPYLVKTPDWDGPKKVNIGSGPRVHAGYENIDVRSFPGVRKVDLMKGLPYPDDVLEEVLAEDVLEHFRPSNLRGKILPEIYRVLRPDGRLVAQMPDLHEMVNQWKRGDVDDEMMSMRIHGRQDYPENTHYASYTEESMSKILRRIGFGSVRRIDTRNWNMVLEARKSPGAGSHKSHRKEFTPQRGNGEQTDWNAYWEQRSLTMGQLSVTPASWNHLRQRQESDKLFKLMGPEWVNRSGALTLDYGCGVGRMSIRLQEAGIKVKGVDVSPNMIKIARDNGVDAALIDNKRIPYEDDTFDCLFVCTVLQHIPDLDLQSAVKEIKRVLKPGAFVMLFENCYNKHGRTSSSGHVVFREPGEYASLFDGIKEYFRVTVEGEEHVLMWGTLTEPSEELSDALSDGSPEAL